MRSLKQLEADEVVIDKWGYACFAGVIGLALAYDYGWVSPYLGFALGFFSAFFALIGLELWGRKIRLKRQLNHELAAVSNKPPASPQVQIR